jgi:hypothetical protein
MTWYSCDNTVFGVFGNKLIFVRPSREKGILENFKTVSDAAENVGGQTENGVFLMLEKMIDEKIFADRLIVCSDLQIGDGKGNAFGYGKYAHGEGRLVPKLVKRYRETVNPNFWYYSVCFNGYGTNVIQGPRTALINGWSEKIFKFINTVEADSKSQLDYVENLTVQ